MTGYAARRLPDFIVGGAPRSGTTWLYHLLDRHPDVYMAKPIRPEPKFFLVDDIFEKGLDFYAETWFSGVPDYMLAGEKSTNYLESEVVAERIHESLPETRLVFVLRDPVDRAVSNWRWSRMNGFETLSLPEALRLEEQREAEYQRDLRFSRPFSYFSRGLYRRMLQPFVDRFGLDQIVVLRYEEIAEKPTSVAETVHRFLGIPERPDDSTGLGTINPSEAEEVDTQTIAELRRRYQQPNEELADLLGPRFSIWRP